MKNIIRYICLGLSKVGVYIYVFWGRSHIYPPASKLGLSYTNRYMDGTYRLKFVYLNKGQSGLSYSLISYYTIIVE